MVTLPTDEFRRLERLAERDERATDQQASFFLRRALASAADEQEVAGPTSSGPSGPGECPRCAELRVINAHLLAACRAALDDLSWVLRVRPAGLGPMDATVAALRTAVAKALGEESDA